MSAPTATEQHNMRRKQLAQGLRAGLDFERSALAAAAFVRARYGCVPIRDTEGFFLCELGLTGPTPLRADPHPRGSDQ